MVSRRHILTVFLIPALYSLVSTEAAVKAADMDADKLVGVWVRTKTTAKRNIPLEIELTKDGKVNYLYGGVSTDGTYSVDGDQLTMKLKNPKKGGERPITSTIVSLKDDVLITKNATEESEFTKKKKGANVDADKLVGTWVQTKVNGKKPDVPLEFELTKDGKVNYSLGNSSTKGTYRINGDKLTIQMAPTRKGAKSRVLTSTIVSVTDEILVAKTGEDEGEYKKK